MANATLNIEVQAEVEQAVRGLSTLKTTFNDFHAANQDAAGALGEFGISLTALDNPITAVASGIKDSIDTTVKWGESINKLTRATGLSAEQASKMAVVLGDFGIKTDSLDRVVKTFTKNGLEFNLDTIKKLAVEYQAIQDPVARDEFAFKNFGRSGLEMNEILSKTPQELQDIGDKADYSGKIMSGAGVEAVQQFGIKTAELTDKLDGLKIAIGGPLVGALSSAIDGFTGLVAVSNALGIAIQAKLGIISYDEAAARADAAAHGDLFAEFKNVDLAAQGAAASIERVKDDTVDLTINTNASAVAYESMSSGVVALTDAQIASEPTFAAQAAALQLTNDKLGIQAGLQGDLTTAMIFNTAAAGLSEQGQLALGLQLGILNKSTYDATETILGLNKGVADGTITEGQAIDREVTLAATHGLLVDKTGAAADATKKLQDRVGPMGDGFGALAAQAGSATTALQDVKAAEDAIKDKIITITTNYINNTYGTGGPGYEPPQPPPGRASGGPVFAGMPYTVGESGP